MDMMDPPLPPTPSPKKEEDGSPPPSPSKPSSGPPTMSGRRQASGGIATDSPSSLTNENNNNDNDETFPTTSPQPSQPSSPTKRQSRQDPHLQIQALAKSRASAPPIMGRRQASSGLGALHLNHNVTTTTTRQPRLSQHPGWTLKEEEEKLESFTEFFGRESMMSISEVSQFDAIESARSGGSNTIDDPQNYTNIMMAMSDDDDDEADNLNDTTISPETKRQYRQAQQQLLKAAMAFSRIASGIEPTEKENPKEEEEEVEDKDAKLQKAIWNLSLDSIVVTDHDRVIQHVNPTMLQEFGIAADDDDSSSSIIGTKISDLLDQKDENAKKLLESINDYVQGHEKTSETATSSTTIIAERVVTVLDKAGRSFPCIVGVRPMKGDDDADSKSLIFSLRNISSLQSLPGADKYLLKSASTTDTPASLSMVSTSSQTTAADQGSDVVIVDKYLPATSPSNEEQDTDEIKVDDDSFDSIIVCDDHGIILQVNQTTLVMFRYKSKKYLLGKNISTLVGGGMGKLHDTFMAAYREKHHSSGKNIGKTRLLFARRRDGREFPCSLGLTKRQIGGEMILVGYIRDMTALRGTTIPLNTGRASKNGIPLDFYKKG